MGRDDELEKQPIERAYSSLPPDCRAALWLNLVEGEEVPAISECLGITERAVRRRIRKALSTLAVIVPPGSRSRTAIAGLIASIPTPPPSPTLVLRLNLLCDFAVAAGLISRRGHQRLG